MAHSLRDILWAKHTPAGAPPPVARASTSETKRHRSTCPSSRQPSSHPPRQADRPPSNPVPALVRVLVTTVPTATSSSPRPSTQLRWLRMESVTTPTADRPRPLEPLSSDGSSNTTAALLASHPLNAGGRSRTGRHRARSRTSDVHAGSCESPSLSLSEAQR